MLLCLSLSLSLSSFLFFQLRIVWLTHISQSHDRYFTRARKRLGNGTANLKGEAGEHLVAVEKRFYQLNESE